MSLELNAEPDDLRSTIAAQFEDTGADKAPEVVSEPEPPAPEPVADAAPTESKSDHPSDPARYADGTFKPTKAEAAPEKAAPVKAAEAVTKSPSTDIPAKASEPAVSSPQDAPPVGWTADAKAEWSKLSPAIKAAVAKREAEISDGGRQWSEQRRRYESLLAPVAQASARRGMAAEDGLKALIAAQDFLDRDPAAAIVWLARQSNVDLSTLIGQSRPAEGSPEQQPQPDLRALIRAELTPYLQPIHQRFQADEQRAIDSNYALTESFASKHEHFDAVADDIVAILPAIKAAMPMASAQDQLQEAYDRAVYANPQTRQTLLDARDRDAEQRRTEQAKAHAAKARIAASSVTGSPTNVPQTVGKDSLRAEIEAAFDAR